MKRTLLILLSLCTVVLVGLGAYVRVTGAGLACPDWPLCHGAVIPKMEGGVVQEMSHRMLAGLVGLLTVGAALLIWKERRTNRFAVAAAIFFPALVFVQAVFGGLTVLMSLSPLVVTTHLILGTIFFQCVVLLTYGTLRPAGDQRALSPQQRGTQHLLVLLAVLTFAQIAIGGLVSTGGGALACPKFPMCGASMPDGSLLPVQQVQMLHRIVGLLLSVLVFAAWFRAKRLVKIGVDNSPRVKKLLGMTLGLVVFQILLGVGNIHAKIVPAMSVAHLLIAEGILLKLLLALREVRPGWFSFFEVLGSSGPALESRAKTGAGATA